MTVTLTMAPSNLKSPPSYSVDVENIIERYKHYVPTDAKQKHRDLFYQCIKRIESKFDEKKTWTTPDIPFNVCTSLDDDDPLFADRLETALRVSQSRAGFWGKLGNLLHQSGWKCSEIIATVVLHGLHSQ